ncbi:MAG: hypothetical protein LBQ67_04880 [Treponema sp.]|jgi:hypothetical protein|nr:hypothetical protein [Treponema sp.]
MNLKRPGVFLGFFCLLAFPLQASVVSILVIETGLNQETVVKDYAALWEDGIMAVFFDAGHIVTNAAAIRAGRGQGGEFSGEAGEDFDEAARGGADYFILALLDYKELNGTFKPSVVSLRLYTLAGRKLIYEGKFPAGGEGDGKEEHERAREAARILISHIKDR